MLPSHCCFGYIALQVTASQYRQGLQGQGFHGERTEHPLARQSDQQTEAPD